MSELFTEVKIDLSVALTDALNTKRQELLAARVSPAQFEMVMSWCRSELPDIITQMLYKGTQYTAESPDPLANFGHIASLFEGITPELVLLLAATKQWQVLCDWASSDDPSGYREIDERLLDVIGYMLLLAHMRKSNPTEEERTAT